MRINQAGLDLIKSFEGLRLKAYVCPAGILTIGYGHTGPDVLENQEIDATTATNLLERDLERFEDGVESIVRVYLTDNQFSALVCFAFNLGLGALAKSTLLKVLNEGQFSKAADELLKWNKARGLILPGLTRRRQAERILFLS